MKPISIFSHNILQCCLGTNEDGPIVQTATLAEINQLSAFDFLLAKYWQIINNGGLAQPPKNILKDIGPEFLTLQSVLAHYAYSIGDFQSARFAGALLSPNIWLGQSYYRIRRLIQSDIPKADIISAIYLVSHYEAAGADVALKLAVETLPADLITLNTEVLKSNSPEAAQDSL